MEQNSYHTYKNCLLLILVVILFSNCTNQNKKQTDYNVFRYNEHKNISSLDPAFAKDNANIWAVNQIFNGLVQMNDNLEVKPCIASSWNISNDHKTYIFNLRDDVYFHKHKLFGNQKTRTVSANDFVFSFNRIKDELTASPGRWVMDQVNDIKAVNSKTLKIELKSPFPAFLGLLTMKYCSVVPHEIVNAPTLDFRKNPIGTGPFKFKLWKENIKLVLRKNYLYFEADENSVKLPYLEAIAITFIPDKQSEYLEFIKGNIDFISGIEDAYKDDIIDKNGALQNKYLDRIKMLKTPYLNTEYIAFNLSNENLVANSKALRKAINIGFDRSKMIKYLRNGIGVAANNCFIPKGLPGHDDSQEIIYNPELSKKLIKGFKDESGILNPKIKLTTTANYLSFCEYIQRELKNNGLNIDIEVIPAAALKEAKANGKLSMFRASWIADYPDAQNYLSLFYSKNFSPFGPNYSFFNNQEFDNLYQQSFGVTGIKKRIKLYQKMDALINTEIPVIPLFYDEVIRFTSKKVKGLGINSINLLNLKSVKK